MKATIVFQKNWEAIHERNEDGSNKYRYIINMGSSRSSKTISLIQLYDLYARSYSNKRLTCWRDTKTDAKKTILSDALKFMKSNGLYKVDQEFNKTESIFTYPNDSTFEIHGTDDEETVHGLTQDCTWLNEPYKISRDTFDQLDQRTSDFVFIDYNPKKGHWVEDIAKDKRAIIIHSTFKDNPFCPVEQRNKILSYQSISACDIVLSGLIDEVGVNEYNLQENNLNFTTKQVNEALRCIENENKNSANLFNWQVYGLGLKAEKPNRIFKFKEISDNEYHNLELPVYYACDWGKVDPWAIVEAKYKDGNLYLHERNYLSENQWRENINSNERNLINAYDNDDDNSQEGIVVWLFEKLGIPKDRPIICDTNRPIKIAILRRKDYDIHLSLKPKGSILDGIDLIDNLNVFYTKSSVNLAYEQENYSRKVDRHGVVLEEPEDKDNHTMDCVRYISTHLQSEGILIKV
jgi:phage terminase large subunit